MTPTSALTGRRIALTLVAGAIVGFSIFGTMVYRAVSVERVEPVEVRERFFAIRSALGSGAPLLTLDDQGQVVRRQEPGSLSPRPISRFGVLAWHPDSQLVVVVDVPFWFFKLKGPAAQYAVRGTGLDLERLHITAPDLERYGPALVIDHERPRGDRLLVWTE